MTSIDNIIKYVYWFRIGKDFLDTESTTKKT